MKESGMSQKQPVFFVLLFLSTQLWADTLLTSQEKTVLAQIPDKMNQAQLNTVLDKFVAAPISSNTLQNAIVTKVGNAFIARTQKMILKVSSNLSREIEPLEKYKKDPKSKRNYESLVQSREQYYHALGVLAQLKETTPEDTFQWVADVLHAVHLIKNPVAKKIPISSYRTALQSLKRELDVMVHDPEYQKLVPYSMPLMNRVQWGVRGMIPVIFAIAGGFLMSQYMVLKKAPEIAQLKRDYKKLVNDLNSEFGLNLTGAEINEATENLSTTFLEGNVQFVQKKQERWAPKMPKQFNEARDWLYSKVPDEAKKMFGKAQSKVKPIMNKIPNYSFSAASIFIWLTDKMVYDILPWSFEAAIGLGMVMGTVTFINNMQGLLRIPEYLKLLGRCYKMKTPLLVVKYGGGVAGFIGLYSLINCIKQYVASSLNERVTKKMHAMVTVLAPYRGETTGGEMKPEDFGRVMHEAYELYQEVKRIAPYKREWFKHDLRALQLPQMPVHNRIQLINSMYQTYNLATVKL